MKVKLSWLSFLPGVVLLIIIKALELSGVLQAINSYTASYLSVGVVVLMFIANMIFSVLDKKTSPIYIIKRNMPAGIFALLSAACIASKSFLTIIQSLQSGVLDLLNLATSAFGIIAAVAFVVVSLAHIQGRNYMPRIGICLLSIPVWFGLLLTGTFLDSRTVSAVDIDPVVNFLYIFAMILCLNLPMVICAIDGKNAVKGSFAYGFPMISLGLLYGFNTIFSLFTKGLDYSENVVGAAFVFMSVYMLIFLVEMTENTKTVDEQEILFDADEFDGNEDYYGLTKDDVAMSEQEYDGGDYIYGYLDGYGPTSEEVDDFVTDKDEDYLDQDYMEVESDDVFVKAEKTEADVDEDAIFISKDAAEAFEHNILGDTEEINEKPQKSTEKTEKVSEPEAEVTAEKPVNEMKNLLEEENETMSKIDRLLEEIGSID